MRTSKVKEDNSTEHPTTVEISLFIQELKGISTQYEMFENKIREEKKVKQMC